MGFRILAGAPAAGTSFRTLTEAEVLSVSGGLSKAAIAPYMPYPLPQPIAPMPPKSIGVPATPIDVMSAGTAFAR